MLMMVSVDAQLTSNTHLVGYILELIFTTPDCPFAENTRIEGKVTWDEQLILKSTTVGVS